MAEKLLTMTFDSRAADRKFRALLLKVERPKRLMKTVEGYVMAVTRQLFFGKRPDNSTIRGVRWPKLKQSTKDQKRNLVKRGKAIVADRPLVRTGKFRDSIKVLSRNAKGFLFGTRLKGKGGFSYPGAHNKGSGKLPKRMWLFLNRKDYAQMTKMTVDHLNDRLKQFKSYVGK